jgi:hypothetical protein
VPSPDNLSPEEFLAAYLAFTMADKVRLNLIARWWTKRTPFDWEDLLHEAFQRTLAGTRKCPRDVPILRFLSGVMRSIRSEWLSDFDREHDPAPDGSGADPAADRPLNEGVLSTSAEEHLEWMNILAKARKCLTGDEEALKFLKGILDGWDRSECMKQFQWTTSYFETIRKRFNRKMARLGEQLREG